MKLRGMTCARWRASACAMAGAARLPGTFALEPPGAVAEVQRLARRATGSSSVAVSGVAAMTLCLASVLCLAASDPGLAVQVLWIPCLSPAAKAHSLVRDRVAPAPVAHGPHARVQLVQR